MSPSALARLTFVASIVAAIVMALVVTLAIRPKYSLDYYPGACSNDFFAPVPCGYLASNAAGIGVAALLLGVGLLARRKILLDAESDHA